MNDERPDPSDLVNDERPDPSDLVDQVRLLYVGMTRAKSQLQITSSGDTVFTQRLVELVAP